MRSEEAAGDAAFAARSPDHGPVLNLLGKKHSRCGRDCMHHLDTAVQAPLVSCEALHDTNFDLQRTLHDREILEQKLGTPVHSMADSTEAKLCSVAVSDCQCGMLLNISQTPLRL